MQVNQVRDAWMLALHIEEAISCSGKSLLLGSCLFYLISAASNQSVNRSAITMRL